MRSENQPPAAAPNINPTVLALMTSPICAGVRPKAASEPRRRDAHRLDVQSFEDGNQEAQEDEFARRRIDCS